MKFAFVLLCVASISTAHAAGDRIYKCGNEFTNMMSDAEALAKNCKPLSGGNVTVIQAAKVPGKQPIVTGVRTDEQKSQDSDARLILEAELRKAEAKRADLLKEYNNGEPEKQGAESRNYQKYQDRVADLKAAIARADGDIAGIKRELARLPASASSAASGSSTGTAGK